jgi:N-acetylated-alpha-linked acidic dipeptidase
METFGDPGYRYHAAAARVAAAMLLRLANADVLPYDYVEFARTMRRQVASLQRRVEANGGDSVTALDAAVARMEAAAGRFATARDGALRAGAPARAVRERTNRALLQVERALTRPEGLRTRPWYRNLIYAADENNGYSTMVFPSVGEALRSGDSALAAREIADLAARFDGATAALDAARAAIGGR